MDVVAFLSPPLLSHLKIVLGREHDLIAAQGWDELALLVRRRAADVAILDPGADGVVHVADVRDVLARFPSLPVVLYTSLSPHALRAVVELAKVGLEHVVLHRFDDEPKRFLELIERMPGYRLGDRLLEALARPLAAAPVPVAQAIERMVRMPTRYSVAQDLAVSAGMTVRSLYRHLEAAGLASPKTLVMGARLLRAYAYMRDPGHALKDVSAKLGYSSPWMFTRQMREMIGRTPRDVRQMMPPGEFVAVLAAGMRATHRGRR